MKEDKEAFKISKKILDEKSTNICKRFIWFDITDVWQKEEIKYLLEYLEYHDILPKKGFTKFSEENLSNMINNPLYSEEPVSKTMIGFLKRGEENKEVEVEKLKHSNSEEEMSDLPEIIESETEEFVDVLKNVDPKEKEEMVDFLKKINTQDVMTDEIVEKKSKNLNIEDKMTDEKNFKVSFLIEDKDIGRIKDELMFNDNIIDGFIE